MTSEASEPFRSGRRRAEISVLDDRAKDPETEIRFYLWLYEGETRVAGPLRFDVVDSIGREQDLGRVTVAESVTETAFTLDGAEWLRMNAHAWEQLVVAAIGDR